MKDKPEVQGEKVSRRKFLQNAAVRVTVATAGVTLISLFGAVGCQPSGEDAGGKRCSFCTGCLACTGCTGCTECISCTGCLACTGCIGCTGCIST